MQDAYTKNDVEIKGEILAMLLIWKWLKVNNISFVMYKI